MKVPSSRCQAQCWLLAFVVVAKYGYLWKWPFRSRSFRAPMAQPLMNEYVFFRFNHLIVQNSLSCGSVSPLSRLLRNHLLIIYPPSWAFREQRPLSNYSSLSGVHAPLVGADLSGWLGYHYYYLPFSSSDDLRLYSSRDPSHAVHGLETKVESGSPPSLLGFPQWERVFFASSEVEEVDLVRLILRWFQSNSSKFKRQVQ